MRIITRILLVSLLLGGALLPGRASAWFNSGKPYVETSGKKGWHPFLRAAKKNPADQLEYAHHLRDTGRLRAARRQYLALTTHWPASTEAGPAQWEYARLVDARGKLLKAFDEYQRLFDQYTGSFPYDEVLARQFEIAVQVMERKKGRFLFFPGFAAPERAVPLFEKVIANGPQWSRAAEAQFNIGKGHEKALAYEEAIAAYMVTQQRYPDHAIAEQASYRCAYCFYVLAQESPNNLQLLESAAAAMTLFINKYPNSEMTTLAREYRNTLQRDRARIAYNVAQYYDRGSRSRPGAALIAYQTLVREYPNSDWTELAKIRIQALSENVETTE